MPVRVVVCGKHTVTREGLRAVLSAAHDLSVVSVPMTDAGSVSSPAASADVMVVDIPAEPKEIDQAVRLTRTRDCDRSQVVAITHDTSPVTVDRLLESGACGIVAHDAEAGEMRWAVRAAARRQLYLASNLAGGFVAWLRAQTVVVDDGLRSRMARLSPREREVLVALARGQSLEDTAKLLFISNATVRTHVYRIRHKLYARDRAELISLAFRAGLVGLAAAV